MNELATAAAAIYSNMQTVGTLADNMNQLLRGLPMDKQNAAISLMRELTNGPKSATELEALLNKIGALTNA